MSDETTQELKQEPKTETETEGVAPKVAEAASVPDQDEPEPSAEA